MAEASGPSSAGSKREKETHIQIKELGLTQIDGNPKDHPYVADVVFVHGLQGHPQRTWQSKVNAKSDRRPRNPLKTFSRRDTDEMIHEDLQRFWPADLLAHDFEDVRILTFGYDSKVTKGFMAPSSKNGIFQHGNSFLRALGRARNDCRQRPIVFVAHSLGGLVVKQALIEARKQTHDQELLDVYESTHAVIFFGTPHRGADLASWERLLSDIAKAVQLDTNSAVLRDLDPMSGSSKLVEMRRDFDNILQDDRRSRELRIYSFQEEEGMMGLKMFGDKVVPDYSSSFDSRKHGSDTIHANHMNMCRFNAKDDDGYEKFSGVLAKYIGQIRTEKNEAGKARREDLLRTLDFAERRSREDQLLNFDTKEETFQWIWSSTSFEEWLSSRDGVYWISGKPGSGKSTLLKHLVRHDRTKLKLRDHHRMSWISLHFFFDFRAGKSINNSFEGLLRSLLYQLIDAIPQFNILEFEASKHGNFSDWPEYRLRDALCRSLEKVNEGVCIFVDGLDEYEGDIFLLVQFLKSLASCQTSLTKICVSSRPEPIPSQQLQDRPNLSMSEHNASGIRSYCLRTLQDLLSAVRDDSDISQLSRSIVERAEGVFLWARFAMKELMHGYCEAETMGEIEARLEEIPQGLEEIYDRMLARLKPPAKKECLTMLQLVCFAKRELLWHEFFVAIKFAMNTDLAIVERICDDNRSAKASEVYETFAKRLRAKAVGLLEFVPTSEGLIDKGYVAPKLIHKSVRTYLDRKGWQTLGALAGNNSGRHEEFYVATCTRYLKSLLDHCELDKNTSRDVLETRFDTNEFYCGCRYSDDASEVHSEGIYPFFAYAATHIFDHASSLEQEGQSSYPQLQEVLTGQVVHLHLLDIGFPLAWPCKVCNTVGYKFLQQDFDSIHVAFLHGLVSYCKDDLRIRSPPPTQMFWQQALDWILPAQGIHDDDVVQEMMSLVLPNLTTINAHHLNLASHYIRDADPGEVLILKLLLEHPSVQDLQLVDNEGQICTLFWLFTLDTCNTSEAVFNTLVDRAKRRGESVRERCGPKGNLVETLLEQSPSIERMTKLLLVRKHYQSMSWPFEYDPSEIGDVGW